MSDAISAGARGICLSETKTERIRVGIDCVVNGEVWLDEAILCPLLCNRFNEQVASKRNPIQLPQEYRLTEREISVLQLVSSGYSNKRIASELYISVETVKSHLRRIMERLSASDRTEAAVKAIRANIL